MDSGHSKMPCASSGTGMLSKPYQGIALKQIDLVSFFFSLVRIKRHSSLKLNRCRLV